MYGRIFSSMFTGSMVGKGSPVFAVMSYVICHMRADETVGAQVDLNVTLLSVMIGETEEVIQRAIDYLCSPDAQTTSPDEDGRRLVKVGAFAYRVVNGAKYMAIRNLEEQRESARLRKSLQRERELVPGARPVPARCPNEERKEYNRQKQAEWRARKKAKEEASQPVTAGHAKSRFAPPSLAEIKLLMLKSGLPESEADKFFNYYGSNGWRVGRNPMRSVVHAVGHWKSNYEQFRHKTQTPAKPDHTKGF